MSLSPARYRFRLNLQYQQQQPQHLSLGMLWQILHLRGLRGPARAHRGLRQCKWPAALYSCSSESFGQTMLFSTKLPFSPLQFEALDLLSASQVAQLAAQSGALNNADLIRLVFDRLDGDNALQDVGEFLTALLRTSQALDINPVVRDIMMNRTFAILSLHFEDFESHDWVSWFTVKLVPLLPSLTAEMLQRVTSYTDCDAYHVIVGALSSVFEQMTSLRQQELTPVLLGYLKQRRASGRSSGAGPLFVLCAVKDGAALCL
ncbi:hypothetical protein ABG768_016140 [Culter alburnus]|uniref:Uncharacterized protein n=1 Tax=Culter alburnus TaxID=194366 RepID=A0AAW1Z1B7_CULAL